MIYCDEKVELKIELLEVALSLVKLIDDTLLFAVAGGFC